MQSSKEMDLEQNNGTSQDIVKSDNGHMSGETQGIWLLVGVASFYKVQDREKFDC